MFVHSTIHSGVYEAKSIQNFQIIIVEIYIRFLEAIFGFTFSKIHTIFPQAQFLESTHRDLCCCIF